jgi:hypothetical protein
MQGREMAVKAVVFAVSVFLASATALACILGSWVPSTSAYECAQREPPTEYLLVIGFVYETDGVTPATNCIVNVTNKDTGDWGLTMTDDSYGYYEFNTGNLEGYVHGGEVINVTATKDLQIGWNESVNSWPYVPYVQIDVTISAPGTSFVLKLVPGWNLVSIPLIDHGYNASTLPLTMLDVVCGWNTTRQAYGTYIFGVTPPSYDFVIEGGTGYCIHSQAAETLHLRGSVPDTPQYRTIVIPSPPGPLPLPPSHGWAFIGFAFSNWIGKSASDIPSFFNGTIDIVAKWSPLSQTWISYIVGVPPSDFPLLPGEGYLIHCSSGTLYYGP